MASIRKLNQMQKGSETTLFVLLSMLAILAVLALGWLPVAPVQAVEPVSGLAAYVDLHVTRPGVKQSSAVCANAPRIVAAAPYLQP